MLNGHCEKLSKASKKTSTNPVASIITKKRMVQFESGTGVPPVNHAQDARATITEPVIAKTTRRPVKSDVFVYRDAIDGRAIPPARCRLVHAARESFG